VGDRDPRTRRGLLAAFFDEIDIVDQEIVSVVPRKDYAAEVVALLDKLDDQHSGCSPNGTLFEPAGRTRKAPNPVINETCDTVVCGWGR
jgi:hypothetical protein